MRKLLTIVIAALMLSGCLPMAFFATGSGSGYGGLGKSAGTFVTGSNVNATCLSPKLRLAIWEFEGHFGKKIIMSSGYRDIAHNASVGGAENSYHTRCMAADFYIPGIPKERLIAFAEKLNIVGGLGCYPGRTFIHVDVRDRAKGASRPTRFNGC